MQLMRLARDRRGSAAVEFALIIPFIMLLYYGLVEGTQALLVKRRASYLTTAVGDLITQSAQVRESDITDVFDVSTAVMKPFPTESLSIRITSIQFDANGTPSIVWSRSRGTIAAADLSSIDPKLKVANTALMRAETRYVYSTPFQKMLPGAFTFQHRMDLRPRSGVAIPIISG